MIKKTVVAIAVSAIACAAWTSSAAAKKHARHMASAPAAQAETIPGVNPMTNAPAAKAVEHPAPFVRQPGVNPM
jgi:hypothetical protein